MAKLNQTVGFIGAGNMGEAMVQGLLRSETARSENIYVADVSAERLDHFKREYAVHTTSDNKELFKACDVIVFAVKPQVMDLVLENLTRSAEYGPGPRKIVVSIAAGYTIDKMSSFLYASFTEEDKAGMPIFRIIPNTPALVLEGMSGMSCNEHAREADIEVIELILSSIGKVLRFAEEDIDAVTAVSGSGPAYMFFLIELMVKAGEKLGLKPEDAFSLSLQTMKGAVKLMESSHESPEELRRRVTSPGGTTQAAITHMQDTKADKHMVEAFIAAQKRSKELSG